MPPIKLRTTASLVSWPGSFTTMGIWARSPRSYGRPERRARSWPEPALFALAADLRLDDACDLGQGLKTNSVTHDIERTRFDLIVDAAQVLAHDAQGDELDAADEQHGNQCRRLPEEGLAS